MDLGAAIKKVRLNKSIKQKDLAEMCDITQAYLSLIESNKKQPNLKTIETICRELDIPIPILFFSALDSKDIPEDKKDAFNLLGPSLSNLVSSIFT